LILCPLQNLGESLGCDTTISKASSTLFESAIAAGKGDEDFSAVYEAVRK
jgi:3-hydroxyisobutyrate dehydrogenase-like beta-hydroxyacid dehydrogenase